MKSALSLLFYLSVVFIYPVFCQSKPTDLYAENQLKGKTILVTAPSNYSQALAERFKKEGAQVVVIPAVETFINPNTKSLDHIFEQISQVDWIILPSRKAIDAFFSEPTVVRKKTRYSRMQNLLPLEMISII